MLVVGYEGIAGFLLWCILLPIFEFIPCSSKTMCHKNGVIESTSGAFKDYAANSLLIWQSVIYILSITFLNIAGVSITKYGSAAQRSACDMCRPLIVWIFLMNVEIGGQTEKFNWWQACGFFILAFGVMVYNEFIIIPFFGFNRNTKIAIEEREKLEEERRMLAFM